MEEEAKQKKRPMRWVLIAVLIVAALTAAAWVLVFHVNHFSLELVLTGIKMCDALYPYANDVFSIDVLK